MKITPILDPIKIFEERKTKTDCEIAREEKIWVWTLINQCGYRNPAVHPNFRHKWAKKKDPHYVETRDLNSKWWDQDDRQELKTAKHEIVIPEWFEVVEYGSPCKAFFEKRNLLK